MTYPNSIPSHWSIGFIYPTNLLFSPTQSRRWSEFISLDASEICVPPIIRQMIAKSASSFRVPRERVLSHHLPPRQIQSSSLRSRDWPSNLSPFRHRYRSVTLHDWSSASFRSRLLPTMGWFKVSNQITARSSIACGSPLVVSINVKANRGEMVLDLELRQRTFGFEKRSAMHGE